MLSFDRAKQKTFMQRILRRFAGLALTAPLRLAPFAIQQAALEQVLNRLFRRPVAGGDLDFLEGRSIVLEIVEPGWRWPITLEDGHIRVQHRDSPGHVLIRARADVFARLAAGLADPDTLFFQRRLAIEGDTELALALKNFLDSVDPADLPLPHVARTASRIRRRVASRFAPDGGETSAGADA